MLTELQRGLIAKDEIGNYYDAFRMGTLVDAYITEPSKVDRYQMTVIGTEYTYTEDDFKTGMRMRDSVLKDTFAGPFIAKCRFQTEYFNKGEEFYFNGVRFTLNTRCKYDLDAYEYFMGGDIKSTAAKSQAQFLKNCRAFGYLRSRYFYMRNSGYKKDVIIGVSKVYPHKVFKVFIEEGDELYMEGKHECHQLAFQWWGIYGEDKNLNNNDI